MHLHSLLLSLSLYISLSLSLSELGWTAIFNVPISSDAPLRISPICICLSYCQEWVWESCCLFLFLFPSVYICGWWFTWVVNIHSRGTSLSYTLRFSSIKTIWLFHFPLSLFFFLSPSLCFPPSSLSYTIHEQVNWSMDVQSRSGHHEQWSDTTSTIYMSIFKSTWGKCTTRLTCSKQQ